MLNPVPRWFAGFTLAAFVVVAVLAAAEAQETKDKEVPKDKTAEKGKDTPAPKLTPVIRVVSKDGHTFVVVPKDSGLKYQVLESSVAKEKAKVEVLKDGGWLVRDRKPLVVSEPGDNVTLKLAGGGLSGLPKSVIVGIPDGYAVLLK